MKVTLLRILVIKFKIKITDSSRLQKTCESSFYLKLYLLYLVNIIIVKVKVPQIRNINCTDKNWKETRQLLFEKKKRCLFKKLCYFAYLNHKTKTVRFFLNIFLAKTLFFDLYFYFLNMIKMNTKNINLPLNCTIKTCKY